MASNGTFTAKVILSLSNLSTLTPFTDNVEFGELNGTKSFEEIIKVEANSPCVDITSDCCHNPRLLMLRPASVQFELVTKVLSEDGTQKVENGKPVTKSENEPWKEIKDSGISRDQLAELLSFKTSINDNLTIALGRPQFYFDGLISLLLGTPGSSTPATTTIPPVTPPVPPTACPTTTPPVPPTVQAAKLVFTLNPFWLDKDGNPLDVKTENDPKAVKKLKAVTVQFIAAYAASTPKPSACQAT